jgi:hypothetical protein
MKRVYGIQYLERVGEMFRDAPPEAIFSCMVSSIVIRDLLSESFGLESPGKVVDWMAANIMKNASEVVYFRAEMPGDDYCPKQAARITELSELLFNLQTIPGIDKIFRRIVDDPHSVEATIMELECFMLLVLSGHQFQITDLAKGKGDRMCECEVTLPGGRAVFCEVKAKDSLSKRTESGIYNKLSDARRQLPKEHPGVIFLRVDSKWFLESLDILEKAVQRLFRSSRRIAEVVLVCRETVKSYSNCHYIFSWKGLLNNNSPHAVHLGDGILSKVGLKPSIYGEMQLCSPNWTKFSHCYTFHSFREMLKKSSEPLK